MYVIKERFLDIGDDFDVTDDHGRKVLHVDGKVMSVRDKLVIEDPSGNEVASVHRKLIALRPTYRIEIGGEEAGTVSKKLFTPFREKFTIDVPGPDDLTMAGDLFDHEFTVERGGREVAQVSKRWLSIRDSYAVNIADGENHLLILCAVLALELAMQREEDQEDKERRRREDD